MTFPPHYISEFLVPHSTIHPLRSSNLGLLSIPRSNYKTKGDRAILALTLWKLVPQSVRSAKSLDCFKHILKTHNSYVITYSVKGCTPFILYLKFYLYFVADFFNFIYFFIVLRMFLKVLYI